MLKKRPLFLLLSSSLMLVATSPVLALGFGVSTPATVLGQALDFTVALRVDPGEVLAPECAQAGVMVGDRVLPSSAVRTAVERDQNGQPVIRVRTQGVVDEPVVTVDVSGGCTARVSRRYVLFADPPMFVAPPSVAVERTLATVAAAASDPPAPRAPAAALPASAEPGRTASARPTALPTDRAAQVLPEPAPKPPAKPPRKPKRKAAERPAKAHAPVPTDLSRPRLRLAPTTVASRSELSDEALATVDEASKAVEAAIQAASSAQSRITAAEAGMERLRVEGEAQRAQIKELRERAAVAEGRSRWVMPLMALAIGGLAVWLWLRLRPAARERQGAWWAAAAQKSALGQPEVPQVAEASAPDKGDAASPEAPRAPHADSLSPSIRWGTAEEAPQQTGVLGTRPLVQEDPPEVAESRGVSAEELIDLEQQAEFFVVLGQDDAAIDLLVSHLRESGGASPLPYLKLLDIYRRRDDAEAYERTRGRFNRRFNAHAPVWGAPVSGGRTLDDYPAVMHWIQRIWSKPLDAMAELESMLFRRDGSELFDLPAYRELLFLYTLARDLTGEDDPRGASLAVDLLLPMFDGLPAEGGGGGRPQDKGAVAAQRIDEGALDLDLSLTDDSRTRPPT